MIPTDPAQIANLEKIAELNREAGDWQFSPVLDSDGMPTTSESSIKLRLADRNAQAKQALAAKSKT